MSMSIHTLSDLAAVGDPDPHARVCRVDELAFGAHNDAGYVEAKRRIVDPDRFVVVTADTGTGQPVDVGCAGNFGFDLTLAGGATVPVSGLSDVGVLPTHRRQGILRSMLERLLQESADRGEVASLLTASEATIYGRFGYGMVQRRRALEIPVRDAALRADASVADGELSLHLVSDEREHLADLLAGVHDRRAGNGSLSRSAQWWSVMLGDAETYVGGGKGQRVLLHRSGTRSGPGDRGSVDGYALFTPAEKWTDHGSGQRLDVREVVATTPAAELALWRALFDVDLVVSLHTMLPERHLLDDALVDRRALRCLALRDHLWLRPIDIAGLLSARTYSADGHLTLSVTDPMCPRWGGTFHLEVQDGQAECQRVGAGGSGGSGGPDTPGGVSIGVAELGSRVLGEGSFRALARVGRARGAPEQLALADSMFDADPPGWTDTRF